MAIADFTYSIVTEVIRDNYCAKVVAISSPTSSKTVFSGIVASTPEATIIKAARWLIDYAELELMSKDEEEPRY